MAELFLRRFVREARQLAVVHRRNLDSALAGPPRAQIDIDRHRAREDRFVACFEDFRETLCSAEFGSAVNSATRSVRVALEQIRDRWADDSNFVAGGDSEPELTECLDIIEAAMPAADHDTELLEQQSSGNSPSAGSTAREFSRPADPIRAEQYRDRQRAEIKDAFELARLLRESRELLLRVWKNEIETAVRLRRGLPHRSEYPGRVPGDRQWYDLDAPHELALWRTHSMRPEKWKTRELGWPELLDQIHRDTLDAWRCVRAALQLALDLPNAIRERIHDPRERDAQQRLIRALRDAEFHLGQIIPHTSVLGLLDSMELLSPMTAWCVLSRYIEIQRATVSRYESLSAEPQAVTNSAAVDRWNWFAKILGQEFREDADQLDAFVELISDAATILKRTLDSEAATADIPFDPRPLTPDDLNLIRRLLQEFTDSCERCSSVLAGKAAAHESAESLWNDAVSLMGQLLNLIGPERIGRFIIPDRELRQTLAKAGVYLDEHKKPFTRDLAYHEGNAVHHLNWAAREVRFNILNWLPERVDTGTQTKSDPSATECPPAWLPHLDDLVDPKQIAHMVHCAIPTLTTDRKKQWGDPEVPGSGRKSTKWKLRSIWQVLVRQFPKKSNDLYRSPE